MEDKHLRTLFLVATEQGTNYKSCVEAPLSITQVSPALVYLKVECEFVLCDDSSPKKVMGLDVHHIFITWDMIDLPLSREFASVNSLPVFAPICHPIPKLGLSRMFEASRARGFCPSFTRASLPQLHFGNPICH
ncbi:hypothetical protein Tco_1160998 [Tanacetum coccineum]